MSAPPFPDADLPLRKSAQMPDFARVPGRDPPEERGPTPDPVP